MSIWVFGYGSLVWRPGFPFVARHAARVLGWRRRFWQQSTDHRGTPDAPGRVLTVVHDPDAPLWGMAYQVAAAVWPEVEAALDVREQQGYDRADVIAAISAGEVVGPIVAEVRAYMFWATPANPHYIGPEDLAATAAIVRRSRGPSGDNPSYVHELRRALAAMGADDPEVDALAALV
ncbi:MAG TPA: gamma-glutamylcyclotransferase [Kofleriaceae bacterium]|nr:gamma-glutamylcyclotransferase [Kofleriaceae bacterium]